MTTPSKTAFLHALLLVIYIALVAAIMFNGKTLFGNHDTYLTSLAVLSLFTLSATVVGGLVLGKPLMLYLDDKKKEALTLFLQTAGWLAAFTVVFLVVLVVIR